MNKLLVSLILFVCWSTYSYGTVPKNIHIQQEAQNLFEQLRCLSCQTESIAYSQAPFAQELRKWIFQQLKDGQTTEKIKEILKMRYGIKIFLQPPFAGKLILLWLFPYFCLFISSIFILIRIMPQKDHEKN